MEAFVDSSVSPEKQVLRFALFFFLGLSNAWNFILSVSSCDLRLRVLLGDEH